MGVASLFDRERPFIRRSSVVPRVESLFSVGNGRLREPGACYLMRVSAAETSIGEDVMGEDEEKRKESGGSMVQQKLSVARSLKWKGERWFIKLGLRALFSDIEDGEKRKFIFFLVLRLLAVLLVIFVYICTLGSLANAFTLLSSRGLGMLLSPI